jgi:hypothetical protein
MGEGYCYVSIPNRWRYKLAELEPVLIQLFEARIEAPDYWGDWHRRGPELIRGASWVCVVVPDDGWVGRGVFAETEMALDAHREVTILHRSRPHNCCHMPFDVGDGDWVYWAKLRSEFMMDSSECAALG